MSKISCNEVWLIMDSRQFGGIETHLLQLAIGLIQYKQCVRVWLTHRYEPASPLVEKLEHHKVCYGYLDDNHSNTLYRLLKLIKHYKPQAIHCHGYKASLLGKTVKLLTKTRQVSTYHAGETPKGKVKLYDWLDRYSAWLSDHSIAVSNKISAKLPCQSNLFNNFIDTGNITVQHGKQIAFVGRLSHEKAPQRILELAKINLNLDFHFYGDGELKKDLQRQASSNVYFHGHQSEMNTVWPNIGTLIICSDFEGLPLVALEAMARGIIVISTSVGDLPKLIQSDINGFLAQTPSQLNEALNKALSYSETSTKTVRVNAINTIQQHYSTQAIMPHLLKVYRL